MIDKKEIKKRINELTELILNVIDDYCDENNEVTYLEINTALTNNLQKFNGFELDDMIKNNIQDGKR